jgi:hypothetical protein
MVLLGSVVSLVGGIAESPVTVKADASVSVSVKAKGALEIGAACRAKAKLKATKKVAAKSGTAAKTTTKAKGAKGKEAMRDSVSLEKRSGWKAASCLGEQAPNRGEASGPSVEFTVQESRQEVKRLPLPPSRPYGSPSSVWNRIGLP